MDIEATATAEAVAVLLVVAVAPLYLSSRPLLFPSFPQERKSPNRCVKMYRRVLSYNTSTFSLELQAKKKRTERKEKKGFFIGSRYGH